MPPQPHGAMVPGVMPPPVAATRLPGANPHAGVAAQPMVAVPGWPPGVPPYPYPYMGGMPGGVLPNSRWVLNPEDAELLDQIFQATPFPSRQVRLQLASRLQVRPRQVQVWFQNKRQRVKSRGETVPLTGGPPPAAAAAAPAALPAAVPWSDGSTPPSVSNAVSVAAAAAAAAKAAAEAAEAAAVAAMAEAEAAQAKKGKGDEAGAPNPTMMANEQPAAQEVTAPQWTTDPGAALADLSAATAAATAAAARANASVSAAQAAVASAPAPSPPPAPAANTDPTTAPATEPTIEAA